ILNKIYHHSTGRDAMTRWAPWFAVLLFSLPQLHCGGGGKKVGSTCQTDNECPTGSFCTDGVCSTLPSTTGDGANGHDTLDGGDTGRDTSAEDGQIGGPDLGGEDQLGDLTGDSDDGTVDGDQPDLALDDAADSDDGGLGGSDAVDSDLGPDDGSDDADDTMSLDQEDGAGDLPSPDDATDLSSPDDATDLSSTEDGSVDVTPDLGGDDVQKPVQTVCGDITSDTLWDAGSIWLITCTVNVVNGATLTIEPGTTLRFEFDAGIRVNDQGALIADGQSAPILMLPDVSGEPWEGLRFLAGTDGAKTIVRNVTLREAGRDTTVTTLDAAIVFIDVAGFVLTDNTIIDSESRGISLVGACQPGSFSDNVVTDSKLAPVAALAERAQLIGPGSYNSKNPLENVIELYSSVDPLIGDATWIDHQIPYRLHADLRIQGTPQQSATLTIADHVTVLFDVVAGINVSEFGGLIADSPDSVCGTNGIVFDASSTTGSWDGLRFYRAKGSSVVIRGVTLRRAGRGSTFTLFEGALVFEEMDEGVIVENNCIFESDANGVVFDMAFPLIDQTGSRFKGNTIYDNAENPVVIHAGNVHHLGPNLYLAQGKPNGDQTIRILNGSNDAENTVTTNATWVNPGIPYYVDNRVIVKGTLASPATLTLTPGTTIQFDNTGSFLRISDNAALQAIGTQGEPIILANGGAQYWGGLHLVGSRADLSELAFVKIVNGGSGSGGSSIDASLVFQNMGPGVKVDNCSVEVGDGYGIVFENSQIAPGHFLGMTVKDTRLAVLGFQVNDLVNLPDFPGDLQKRGSFDGGSIDSSEYIRVNDLTTLSKSTTLPDLGIPYRFLRELEVASTPIKPIVLTIKANVGLLFPANDGAAGLLIGNSAGLKIEGTAGNQVILAKYGTGGPWTGIRIAEDADFGQIVVDYARIVDAGLSDSFASIFRPASIAFRGVAGGSFSNIEFVLPKGAAAIYFESSVSCPSLSNLTVPAPLPVCDTDTVTPNCCP
ncbi:MAG: hypothetical protein KC609_21265, partial [Myxococcales bacterium]|nr:hypothetical protein [Myxococcales bacterium]